MKDVNMTKRKPIPRYVEREDRCAFGIAYFATEEEALEYQARRVKAFDLRYKGGMFHGMPCGRDATFDKKRADGTTLYAVTD
jgi:hypothetical protein